MSRNTVARFEGEYRRYKALADRAIDQLSADQLLRGDRATSAVAVVAWHVSGNLESRFTDFLTTDGEKPWRDRESEFGSRTESPAAIRAKWERGWRVLFETLAGLEDDDLARTITIRGVELLVDEALLRSLGHTSYHVGQIVQSARRLVGDDWRFLSIPPGGTAAYNANPTRERAPEAAGSDEEGR